MRPAAGSNCYSGDRISRIRAVEESSNCQNKLSMAHVHTHDQVRTLQLLRGATAGEYAAFASGHNWRVCRGSPASSPQPSGLAWFHQPTQPISTWRKHFMCACPSSCCPSKGRRSQRASPLSMGKQGRCVLTLQGLCAYLAWRTSRPLLRPSHAPHVVHDTHPSMLEPCTVLGAPRIYCVHPTHPTMLKPRTWLGVPRVPHDVHRLMAARTRIWHSP